MGHAATLALPEAAALRRLVHAPLPLPQTQGRRRRLCRRLRRALQRDQEQ